MGKKPVFNQNKEIHSLSMKDMLHLESAKYLGHDNSEYVLKQPAHKRERISHSAVILSKSEVAQYFSNDKGNEADEKLVKKAHEAIEVLKEHTKQEEARKTNTAEKSNIEVSKNQIEEVLNLDFTGLITDMMLKD